MPVRSAFRCFCPEHECTIMNIGATMMRRIVLLFFALSVLGRSQTVQQLAQPPIVVKVEMPSESAWTTLVKLVIPTILGAGLALYGVRQTNKHNTAENAANREHQLRLETAKAEIAVKYKSRDNRWEFRKDVYVNLIEATSDMIGRDLEIVETFRSDGPQTDKSRQMLEKAFAAHGLAAQTFVTYCNQIGRAS